ncbi:MAG: hypothetical protein AAFQ94_24890 [Bacteroidota bacterium]
MSKLDRKQLEAKEKQLRKELNEAADEFESQVAKVVGVALVSGLVSYGIYKMLSPGKKSKKKKESSQVKKAEQVIVSKKAKSNSPSTLTRLANAFIPVLVSYLQQEFVDNSSKKD